MNTEISGLDNQLLQTGTADVSQGETMVIPVIEERITVDKKIVETGKVRISKKVTEQEEMIDVPLMREDVQVERVAINRFVDTAPQVRYEGETMIVPVLREVVVVEKRIELIEELHITKRQTQTQSTEHVMLRKEEVTVERLSTENLSPLAGV